jgi:hypothetical protein
MTDEAFPGPADDLFNPAPERAALEARCPPWTVEACGQAFVVRDAKHSPVGYVYFAEAQQQSCRPSLTRDQAWRIAADFAALPELLKRVG